MADTSKSENPGSLRKSFLSLSLESTRKSYYPQLQKQLEAAKENELRLKVLLDNLPACVSFVDATEHYVFVNSRYVKKTGLEFNDIVGHSVEEILGTGNYSAIRDHIRAALDGKQIVIENTTGQNEETRWFETSYIPIINSQGNVTGFHIFEIDLTDKRKAEQEKEKLQMQLIQSQKIESVGRLAGGVAHDFNNMLSIIYGYVGLMLNKIDEDNPFYASLSEVMKAAERSADLTRQLLAFARQQPVAPRLLDVNETIEKVLKMLRRLIGEDIELEWLPGKGIMSVLIDPSQVDQILTNLCINSRDAISGTGKIAIKTKCLVIDQAYCLGHPDAHPGSYVMITVSDNGCGMDRETINQIFEPFFTTKETGKGTGLGLATIYGIIRQNNGFVNVSSTPGTGSSFEILLPVYIADPDQKQEDHPLQAEKGHETILMAEDEPAILEIGKTMLETYGYNVLPAMRPEEAILIASTYKEKINLIISDVVMPGMSGRDLVKKLSSHCPSSKHLYMSGYTSDIIAHHGILDKGINFIQKPFSMQTLSAKVREVLDSK